MSGTDQTSAHLDRGWERLSRGDLESAERSAKAALEHTPKHPEALHLLGSVLAAEERREEALECFRRAMEEDDSYLDPIIGAAELWLQGFHEPDECIRLCDEVLAIALEPEDQAEAALLKLDALLEKDSRDEALAVLDSIPEGLLEAATLYRLGRACVELGRVPAAERHLRAALEDDPNLADARYELGRLLRDLGRDDEGRAELWTAYLLDHDGPREPSLSRETLQDLAEKTRANLPIGMRALLGGVPLCLAPRIGPELVTDGFDPRALCFFAGQPADAQRAALLERIFVYQLPLSLFARTPEGIEQELRAALLIEAAEFFNLSDRDLADRGVSPEEL